MTAHDPRIARERGHAISFHRVRGRGRVQGGLLEPLPTPGRFFPHFGQEKYHEYHRPP